MNLNTGPRFLTAICHWFILATAGVWGAAVLLRLNREKGNIIVDQGCVFCRIVAKEQHAAFVYEDERLVAFLDINQTAVGHTLLVPRTHAAYWWDLPDDALAALAGTIKPILHALRKVFDPPGVLIEQRNGSAAGQEVFHMHVHLIPRGLPKRELHAGRSILDRRAAIIRTALQDLQPGQGIG